MDTNDYKSLAVKLSLWAQGKGIPGASPAWLTRLAKRIADSNNPKLVEHFIKTYGIEYTQANRCSASNSVKTCAKKYGTLNEFFTRRIPFTVDPSDLVSPATCKCTVFDAFQDSTLWVKGAKWSAARLLGDASASYEKYAVGIFRLRPADYHRFHSPVRGVILTIRHIQGGYLSVDPEIVRKRNVLTENNRVVLSIASPVYGLCYFVAVGAAGVGRVTITTRVGDSVDTGDELGVFEFGGSTVVVLIPATKRRMWRRDLVKNSLVEKETYVTVGTDVSSS
jgi:phosphatidylserine decarboxylase